MTLRAVELVRVVDHDVRPGVEVDMGDGDAGRPAMFGQVTAAAVVGNEDGVPVIGLGPLSRGSRFMETTGKGDIVTATETGQVTGTKDKDYNIIWFVEQCLSNALRMEIYAADAERDGDSELAEFFHRAQGESRKGAKQGKELLARRLAG